MNCFSYQSYQSFQFQPMYFGSCLPAFPQIPPQACGPMFGSPMVECNYWAGLMQAQQSLYQGWQNFCGCHGQQPPSPGQQPQFGCQPPEIHIHHHWIDCQHPQQQPQPQPQQQQPRPRPTPRPTPRPLPRPPMTRIPPVPAPPRTSRPAPAIPPAPTPDRQGTYAAHTYGAFGPGGGGTSFVGNAAYHNNTYGGQAVLLNRSGASTSPTTHQTAVTVSGFRV